MVAPRQVGMAERREGYRFGEGKGSSAQDSGGRGDPLAP